MKKDFLCLSDIASDEGWEIVENALRFKKGEKNSNILEGKVVGLLFAKPSTRTRVSFEVGITKLGGKALYMTSSQLQMSRGEDIRDTARTLSRYLDGIVIRTYAHAWLEEFARYSDKPVINALTDFSHPCQILADVQTIYELFGERIKEIKIAYIGDGNNVANSLIVGAGLFGLKLYVATPSGFEPNAKAYQLGLELSKQSGGEIVLTNDPVEAVENAHVVYTDVWVSMGDTNGDQKVQFLKPFQVNEKLLKHAEENVKVLHCLPAKKGQEITEEVFEKHKEEIFLQAENRLWVQMALMDKLFGEFFRS
ncbi:MAG: ornithine carbamoyltransferase [Gammaproteobacteria bacterium]|nr:MAG: ornithine carbamoyltransferase [Gammaproteobacteria bacterium]